MREAVIVSTARTPIGRAFRGAFNRTPGATMGGHVVRHAVERAGIDPDEVEDVVLGCAMPEGGAGRNVARLSALQTGFQDTPEALVFRQFQRGSLERSPHDFYMRQM